MAPIATLIAVVLLLHGRYWFAPMPTSRCWAPLPHGCCAMRSRIQFR